MYKHAENNRVFMLLLDILSEFIFSKGNSTSIADMDKDTLELLCHKAEDNRVGILLYYYCGRHKVLPESWTDKWSAEFRNLSANELRRADELKNVYKILADNDIEAAPLKGAYLAYNYYPHPALRSMSDFDILIRPDSIEKAFQLMIDNNFTSDYDFRNRCHEPLLSSPRGFVVELHTHITPDSNRCAYSSLWENCRSSEFKDQSISRLSPEISLLHTINHAFRDHLIGGLKGFVDVAYILAGANIDAKKLEECAKKNGFYNELILFMNIFSKFFPEEYIFDSEQIPANLLENTRHLIYNARNAQDMDRHQLMLYREYDELNFFEKLLFMCKKMSVKPVTVAEICDCQASSPMIIYYYFHRAYTYFVKLLLFEKKSKRNSLSRRIGSYQKGVQSYLNGDTK